MPPTTREYQDALISHKLFMSDKDLIASKVVMKNGRPRSHAGGFATVFRLENGTHKWAVKCFTRQIVNLDRYKDISRYINSSNHNFFVHFEYLIQGIFVNNDWHPVIKMEWIEGKSFGDFIDLCYHDRTKMESLMNQWVTLTTRLAQDGVAHCDFHSSNIMLKNDGTFKLLDYDSIFLKSFRNQKSEFVGDPNFQHPQRDQLDFNENTDNFSSWMIYLTLRSIRNHPEIWRTLHNVGDRALIFNAIDYRDFGQSRAFEILRNSGEDNANIARFLTNLTKTDISNIPPFNARAIGNISTELVLDAKPNSKSYISLHKAIRSQKGNSNQKPKPPEVSAEIIPSEKKKRPDYRAIIHHQKISLKNKSNGQK
jgi:hypothetical protein